MELSATCYEKAKKILAFIEANPGCYMQQIASSISTLKGTTHLIVQKMVRADLLTYATKKYRGGKRHFYTATGKALPPRTTKQAAKTDQGEQQIKIDPVAVDQFKQMPGFMRAITPVIAQDPVHSVTYFGHTDEQHKLQSAVIHKEHSRTIRGVVYTGEARL